MDTQSFLRAHLDSVILSPQKGPGLPHFGCVVVLGYLTAPNFYDSM